MNVATRKVNLFDILAGDAWGNKNWAKECSIIIDTGFNGGGLRSHDWWRKYLEYLKSFHPKATSAKTPGALLRFSLGGREGRDSMMGAAIPI